MKQQRQTTHNITTRETGLLRIFVSTDERSKGNGYLNKLWSKPVYQKIIHEAHAFGITSAIAHHPTYGFSANENIMATSSEYPNPKMTVCVELIAERKTLEDFCRVHSQLVEGKMMVYKHIEHWDIKLNTLQEKPFTSSELKDTSSD